MAGKQKSDTSNNKVEWTFTIHGTGEMKKPPRWLKCLGALVAAVVSAVLTLAFRSYLMKM